MDVQRTKKQEILCHQLLGPNSELVKQNRRSGITNYCSCKDGYWVGDKTKQCVSLVDACTENNTDYIFGEVSNTPDYIPRLVCNDRQGNKVTQSKNQFENRIYLNLLEGIFK